MHNDKDRELIENQLRVVMLDRMLKEKYNQIHYLAIKEPLPPDKAEINKKDLDWLLCEHERADELEKKCVKIEKDCVDLQEMYNQVISSKTWIWGTKINHFISLLLTPIRFFYKDK